MRNPKANESEPPKDFFFDAVFAANVEQKHIYNTCAANVVESVLNGYNGTIFAYGQVVHSIVSSDLSLSVVSLQTGAGKVGSYLAHCFDAYFLLDTHHGRTSRSSHSSRNHSQFFSAHL